MTSAWTRTAPGLASAVVLPLSVVSGDAQEVVKIGDHVTCSTCVIEAGPAVTLAPPEDQVWLRSAPMPSLARDREGNYILAPVVGDELIAVFGPDGSFRSSIGRIGEGPGEFPAHTMRILIEVGEGDSVYAINPPHLHRLAPRAESSQAHIRLPVYDVIDAVVLSGGTIAVQASVHTEAGITTIQILRPDGTIEASIAASESDVEEWKEWKARPENVYNFRWDMGRVLGRSNDHQDIWSAHLNRYRISRYGIDGAEKTRVERIAKWFQPYTFRSSRDVMRDPTEPFVTSVHQDADGLLWVAVVRAPALFSPIGEEPAGEEPLDPYLDLNPFLHTTVEVLDPVAGELVARQEFDEYVKFVSTPDHDLFIYSFHPDALGNMDCIVRPLRLRRE